MIGVPTPFQGKASAPRALRLNALLIVIATGWAAFALQHVITGMEKMATIDSIAVLLTLLVRWWSLRTGEDRRLDLGGHFAMAVSSLAIVGVSMLSGQEVAMAPWYLTAVPLFAAYHLGTRAAVSWAAIVSVLLVVIHASGLFYRFEPEYIPDANTWFLGKFVLLGVLLGLSVATSRAMGAYLEALSQREAIIRDRARELAEARDDALEAVRAKNQFLANMSHEIRTPLNGVIGMTSVLLDSVEADDQQEMVRTIQRSSVALLAVLNEVLDFSKLEAGAVQLETIPFDLRECVEDVVDLHARAAYEKGIDLYVRTDDDVPRSIEGDISYLRQVLLNLVGNALKFTDAGEVYIDIKREEDDLLHFRVVDTGIGIPEDKTHLLFRSFSQVDTSTTRKYGGTGLGLAISKRLVELMGGRIWVDSEPGGGSVFNFTIRAPESSSTSYPMATHERINLVGRKALIVGGPPGSRAAVGEILEAWGMKTTGLESFHREAITGGNWDVVAFFGRQALTELSELEERPPLLLLAPLADTRLREVAGDLGVEAVVFRPPRQRSLRRAVEALITGEFEAPGTAFTAFDPSMAVRLPARILLAEDNAVNQRVAVKVLEKLGYDPDVASDGEEVLRALDRRDYDLLFMDLQMPGKDGLETAREIRARISEERPWIVALTASVNADQRARSLQSGMNDFVGKPFDVQTLMSAIERWGGARAEATTPPERPSPAPPQQNTSDPWVQLQEVFEGAPGKLADLVKSHLENGQLLIEEIVREIDDGDDADIARAAHSLKSSAAQFGSDEVSEVAEEIEELSSTGARDEVRTLLPRLHAAWAANQRRLSAHLTRRQSQESSPESA